MSKGKRWGQFDEESARHMEKTAWTGNQSYIHPRLARQIVHDCGITSGRCLDVGCGAARLTIELAKITGLEITGLDSSPHMVTVAKQKVSEHGLESRIQIVQAPVEEMPFPDNYFDLIVSRGAIYFFPDKAKACREIYRVLDFGGHTYIGGGDARGWPRNPRDIIRKLLFKYEVKRRSRNSEWRKLWLDRGQWEGILKEAGISDYTIHGSRFWIEMRKQKPAG